MLKIKNWNTKGGSTDHDTVPIHRTELIAPPFQICDVGYHELTDHDSVIEQLGAM